MQDTLFMRHWAEHHEKFSADLGKFASRALERAKASLSIGSAYERWTGNHGPALLGGTFASIATTLLIGLAVTVLMPAVPAAADTAFATEAPIASPPLLA